MTLLGDAAHPMLPQTGQGAAQAIVDAVTLGTMLSGEADIERGLKLYENERRGKTANLVAQGRRTARVMRMTNPIACYVRAVVVRLIPVTSLAKIIVKVNRRAETRV